MQLYAEAILLKTGWVNNVRLQIEGGVIRHITTAVSPQPQDAHHKLVIPGINNVHSHAFQRAMSGLTERRGANSDSFWSWRQLMYNLALSLKPKQVETIATQLYMEMLEAGFTRVGEFHYLHHQENGTPYNNRAEMAQAIANAAHKTGIGLTLLPVFYAHAGFGGVPPHEEQRRFINSIDSFATLWEECTKLIANLPTGQMGLAVHSLRAVTPQELTQILPLAHHAPIHIHIAEQIAEVENCLTCFGARPVAWLLDNMPVDANWTLVHATHINEAEITALAKSQAVVGLCPITEANLGDGIFPALPFLNQGGQSGQSGQGGRIAIGSDSNIFISAAQELRQLEYSQRLTHHARNVLGRANQSTGLRLFDDIIKYGAQSIKGTGHLAEGQNADFITLACDEDDFSPHHVLDRWIFGQDVHVDCVFVGGKKYVEGGRHIEREHIARHFADTIRELRA